MQTDQDGARRVYIGCFGSGLGHATRMLAVARALNEKGVQVRFSSSSEVAHFIEKQGFECNRLPLADVRYNEDGGLSVKHTVASGGIIMARTYQQMRLEISHMMSFDPDSVLVDSALSTLLAAKISGKRAITILNQLRIESSQRDSVPHRLLSAGMTEGMGTLWELSDEILLPDLPPPYTISESNLWNANIKNTRYIGFLTQEDEGTPDRAHRDFAGASLPKVFWQVSGPPKTRTPLLKKALAIAERLAGSYTFVITGGDPTGETTPKPIPGGWYYEWCGLVENYFRACDLIVSRAGHGTLSQAISHGKPSLLVPIPGQTEQEGNSKKAAKLGVSLAVGQDDLTPERFREAVGRLREEGFASNVSKVCEVARGYDAQEEIIKALRA
ncbi:MAG TPA: glycosyltransferase [Nitrososphaerales archaeon]|nr:glycosyltransferase [Nitrososphaerales archaeon]